MNKTDATKPNTKDKKEKAFLAKKSPTSWGHINLLGYYQFCNGLDDKSAAKLIENWIQGFDWQKNTIYVEKNNGNIRVTEPRPKSTRRLKANK